MPFLNTLVTSVLIKLSPYDKKTSPRPFASDSAKVAAACRLNWTVCFIVQSTFMRCDDSDED